MNEQPAGRILVAEDNRVLADVLRFNLERVGYEVTVAHDGSVAMVQLEKAEFDLLITDYQMPSVNGLELCQHIRRTLANEMPILMCSAKGLELDRQTLLDDWQISELVFKPFSIAKMIVTVRSLLTPAPTSSGACTR